MPETHLPTLLLGTGRWILPAFCCLFCAGCGTGGRADQSERKRRNEEGSRVDGQGRSRSERGHDHASQGRTNQVRTLQRGHHQPVASLQILVAQRIRQDGHVGGHECAPKGSQRHSDRAELKDGGMSPQGKCRQESYQQQTHGISHQHDPPRAQAIREPAAHQHARHAGNAVGGQHNTQFLRAAARRQDQPRQRHRVERIAEDRDRLATEEQIKIAHLKGVQHPSCNRFGRVGFHGTILRVGRVVLLQHGGRFRRAGGRSYFIWMKRC